MSPRRIASWAAVLVVAAEGPAATAAPHGPPHVEVTVIHATRTDGGVSIDPQLRDLPQLTREQPFLRYNVYRLIDRRQLSVETGKPVSETLINGQALRVTLLDTAERGDGRRFHLRASLDEPGKKPVVVEVTAGENEPFFVAGPSYQGGTLFIELAVRP